MATITASIVCYIINLITPLVFKVQIGLSIMPNLLNYITTNQRKKQVQKEKQKFPRISVTNNMKKFSFTLN